jgi:hypothetical protein
MLVVYFLYSLFSYFFGSQPLPILGEVMENETLVDIAESALEGEEMVAEVEAEVA